MKGVKAKEFMSNHLSHLSKVSDIIFILEVMSLFLTVCKKIQKGI